MSIPFGNRNLKIAEAMQKILLIFLILACASCKKSIENSWNSYYLETFRKPGMDDYETLMAAYNSIPDHSKLFLLQKPTLSATLH